MLRRLTILSCLLLSGCLTEPPPPALPTPAVAFNPAAAAYFLKPGTGKIEGQAFLRQVGGTVVTAAGQTVALFPAVPFTDEWMSRLPIDNSKPLQLPTNPEIQPYFKVQIADATGGFVFDRLSPGDYWITTRVTWGAPSQYGVIPQGGNLQQRVHVDAGPPLRVIMTK